MPELEYVRAVFASLQLAAGGVLHTLPAHGSFVHCVPEQPNEQYTSCVFGYEQAPLLVQVPGVSYTVR